MAITRSWTRSIKRFPSFVIVLLLLLSVAGFVWFGGLEKPSATATFQFFGKDNAAISGLTAKFHYGDTGLSKTTDSEGKIFLDVPLDSNLTVSVNKAGFQPFTQSFRISASETHSIQLSAVEVLKKTMVFLDAQNRPLSNKTIQLSYSCSQQSSAAPGNQSISLPELTVDVPQGCGMLTATARVGDSEPQSKPLVSPRTVFIFGAAAPVSSATIEISVKDNQNHALAGIDLKLYDASNNRLVNQTRSDASGTAEFEAIPGRYSVRAIDDSGSFASQTSSTISLNENDSKTVSFTLQPVPSNNRRKLLLKIVDTNSNAAVSGANVRLLLNATEFASLNSSASGIAEKLVSETDQNNYVAIVTHANFLLNVSVGIRPISESDSNARVIALTPKTASNASSIAATILDDQNRAVQGAKVLLQSATIVGLNLSEKVTGNDGNALFENLPAGQYVVKAVLVRNNSETKGTSPTIPLIGGQNERVSIRLVVGTALFNVLVRDDLGQPVAGANIRAYDFAGSGEKLLETVTDSAGKSNGLSFKVDKQPCFSVEKEGFLRYTTIPFSLASNPNPKTLSISLAPTNSTGSLRKAIPARLSVDCSQWKRSGECRRARSNRPR